MRSHISVSGKTGNRTVPLFSDVLPYLKSYLEEERKNAKGTDPLFVWKGHALEFSNVRFILKKLSERAGVKKRLHSHLFRYYLSTYFAANGRQESQMSAFFGYSPAIASHYTKLANADSIMEDGAARPSRKSLEGRRCRCGVFNGFDVKICAKCLTELSPGVDEELRGLREEIKAEKKDSMQTRQVLQRVLESGWVLAMKRLYGRYWNKGAYKLKGCYEPIDTAFL